MLALHVIVVVQARQVVHGAGGVQDRRVCVEVHCQPHVTREPDGGAPRIQADLRALEDKD
jgi:hypothetical protein